MIFILFFPLALIALTCLLVALINPSWLGMKSRKNSMALFGGSFVLFFVLFIIGVANTDTSKVEEPAQVNVVHKPSALPQNTNPQPKPKSREQLIAQQIESSLGVTNGGKQRVISVDLITYAPSELVAFGYVQTDTVQKAVIKVNGDQGVLSGGDVSSGFNRVASDVFKKTFGSFPQVGAITLDIFMPTTDKYGKKEDRMVVVYAMSRPLYEKIQWGNFSDKKLPELLDSESSSDLRSFYGKIVNF